MMSKAKVASLAVGDVAANARCKQIGDSSSSSSSSSPEGEEEDQVVFCLWLDGILRRKG